MKKSKKILGLLSLIMLCGATEVKAEEAIITIDAEHADQGITIDPDIERNENNDLPWHIIKIKDGVEPLVKDELKINEKGVGSIPRGNGSEFEAIRIYGTEKGTPILSTKKVTIKMKDIDSEPTSIVSGIILEGGAKYEGKNLDISIDGTDKNKAGVYNYKGIYLVENDERFLKEKNKEKADSEFKVDNLNIKIKNSAKDGKEASDSLSGYIGGIIVHSDGKDKGNFTSDENVNIELVDKNENADTVLVGIQVSGEGAKATIKNSNIKLESNSKVSEAAPKVNGALSIGSNIENSHSSDKVYTKNSGTLVSTGKMILDTEKAKNAPAISMHGIESKLIADSENSSAEIKAAETAIKFWGKTYDEKANVVIGKDQIVSLKNAKISSTTPFSKDTKNNYLFEVDKNVKNATLNLSGKDTLAEPKNGMLMYVKGSDDEAGEVTLNVKDGAKVIGEIDRSSNGVTKVNLDNGAVWKIDTDKSYRSNLTELNIKNGSILDLSHEGSKNNPYDLKTFDKNNVDRAVTNDGGVITLANKRYNDVLYITGNYEGKNNAQIKMNTLWNKGGDAQGKNSESDKVEIFGTAKGKTKIVPVGVDGKENIIDGSVEKVAEKIKTVPVVVADKAEEGVFYGTAQTNGAGEAQLASELDKGGRRNFYWTLEAKTVEPTPKPNPEPDKKIDDNKKDEPKVDDNKKDEPKKDEPKVDDNKKDEPKVDDNKKDEPKKDVPKVDDNIGKKNNDSAVIYSTVVPAYVNIAKVNRDLGYTTLATLHERRGENDIKSDSSSQAWARIIGKKNKDYGRNRFNLESDIYGVQAGYDFSVKDDENGKRYTGVYFANTTAKTDFFDKFRAENGVVVADKFTGKVKTKDFALGLTTTKYYNNGLYLDLVGQVSFIKNKFTPKNNTSAKQNGNALALSAEIGRTHKITESFTLEPQVQLVYQYLRLKDFNDGIRQVHYKNDSTFRGRIGLRGTFNETFYTVANIWHDFDDETKVNIGADKVLEKYSKTFGEIGIGVQMPVTHSAYIYSDIRYEKSLKSNAKHKGYRGTLGFKYNF